MELFQRRIQSQVILVGSDTMQVEIKLDDTHHEIQLNLEVKASTRTVTAIQGRFIRAPYDRCEDTAVLLENMVGVSIAPGVWRTVARKVGGKEGCTHLYELVMEALRVAMQGYYHYCWEGLPRDERLSFMRQALSGECYVYSHPELKAKSLLED